MDALIIPLSVRDPLISVSQKCRLWNRNGNVSRSVRFVGLRKCYMSWNWGLEESSRRGAASVNASPISFPSSSQGDDAEDLSFPINDAENGATTTGGLRKGEKGSKNGRPITSHAFSHKEGLHKGAECINKANGSVKPLIQQSSEDLRVYGSEARAPSWAVTFLTFAAAFSAGVALAQLRGGLLSRCKPEGIVNIGVAPPGIAAVPYPEQLLGHFRAEEAPECDLKGVLADQSVRLRTAAADAFLRMQDAARNEGIWLIPISGCISFHELTTEAFFDIKAERLQSASDRAKISAPPGYSEHHTGYAVDIGDATDPDTYLEAGFDQGAAYRWLQQNAAGFHFELSFPKNNLQGIMYEPWHWRFVGDDHSLRTFYAQHKF